MVRQVLTLSALVALVQAKAIVTNHCKQTVYVWSIPGKSGVADNLPVGPGKRYEEPWRSGDSTNPGIAIKVSPEENGINEGKSEINFQYAVDSVDSNKIWISLSKVRSQPSQAAMLHTCHGSLRMDGPTQQCFSTDDVELVLCGTERSTPAKDKTSPGAIRDCIGRAHHDDAALQPRQCNSRVVGPKPKHEANDLEGDIENGMNVGTDEEIIAMQDERPVTLPLKDVMRRAAAKHGDSTTKEPLCDLVRKQWPEAACDEKISQYNARIFYNDDCGKKTKNMIPGADCQKLRQAIKKAFPDVDKVSKGTAKPADKEKRDAVCKRETTKLLVPLYGETTATGIVKNMFENRTWTEGDEFCTKSGNNTERTTHHSNRACITPFCEPAVPFVNCHDLEDHLEKVWDIDWTTSDDECGDSRKRDHPSYTTDSNYMPTSMANGKVIHRLCINKAFNRLEGLWGTEVTADLMNTLFDDTQWTSDEPVCNDQNAPIFIAKGKRTKRCVNQYCQPNMLGADDSDFCSDVGDILEDLSKDAGHKVDWTTDDDWCGHERHWEHSHNMTWV